VLCDVTQILALNCFLTLVRPKTDLCVAVDGGWSSWSSWFPCSYQTDSSSGSGDDHCRCRTRQCNNPPPQNGGAPCAGIAVAVTNCTVHGGWTAWSSWSACSQSCGMAVKTQQRTCGNPAPAHGGRVCVGHDRNEIYCTSNPPCPGVFCTQFESPLLLLHTVVPLSRHYLL